MFYIEYVLNSWTYDNHSIIYLSCSILKRIFENKQKVVKPVPMVAVKKDDNCKHTLQGFP